MTDQRRSVGVIAPSPVPFRIGGAERLWTGLADALTQAGHEVDIIKLPSREHHLIDLVAGYFEFARLDLAQFDTIITGKYPAWAAQHPDHAVWMLHPLRGLYDRWPTTLPGRVERHVHPDIASALRVAQLLGSSDGDLREPLQDLLEHLRQAAVALGDAAPDFAIPGPLARTIVHDLDRACLRPGRVRRYAAISEAVAERPGWFPPGVSVSVAHPPLPRSATERIESAPVTPIATEWIEPPDATPTFLVVSRLEAPKRIEMAIDAIKLLPDTDVHLAIVGTGAHETVLVERADNDPRIEFLGRLGDDDLHEAYASATAVVFTPDREDFGYVALEALGHATPVITTTDSGGPLEMITDGATGWVCEPQPAALAKAMRAALDAPAEARERGALGREQAAFVRWDAVVDVLVPPEDDDDRPRIVALSTYPIYPRAQGGPLRAWYLLRAVAEAGYRVEIVSLTVDSRRVGRRRLGDGLVEHTIAVSDRQSQLETDMRLVSTSVAITDIAASVLWATTPAYVDALAERLHGAVGAILVQPYLASALAAVSAAVQPDVAVILDEHNNEISLKADLLGSSEGARWLVAATERIDRAALDMADAVSVTTEEDAESLSLLDPVDAAPIHLIRNGAAVRSTPFVTGADRQELRSTFLRSIGVNGFTELAVFVGSGHQPNIEAGRLLVRAAGLLEDVAFVLLGRHSELLSPREMGHNVFALGTVADNVLARAMAAASIGANPMVVGGGSNLKLTAYFAAGTPVVTTAIGARGIEAPERFAVLTGSRPDQLAAGFRAVIDDPDAAGRRAVAARAYAEETLDWQTLGSRFARMVDDVCGSLASPMPESGP